MDRHEKKEIAAAYPWGIFDEMMPNPIANIDRMIAEWTWGDFGNVKHTTLADWAKAQEHPAREEHLESAEQTARSDPLGWVNTRQILTVPVSGCTIRLRSACAGGHLAIVMWLMEQSGSPCERCSGLCARTPTLWRSVPAVDVDDALFAACKGGHLKIVKWLVEKTGANRFDRAVTGAREGGHAVVENWVLAKWDSLPRCCSHLFGDAVGGGGGRRCGNGPLRSACATFFCAKRNGAIGFWDIPCCGR